MATDIPSLPLAEADPKPWWQSRGVIGSLAVIVTQITAAVGVQMDASALTEILLQIAGLAAGVLALIGRIHAQQPIAR